MKFHSVKYYSKFYSSSPPANIAVKAKIPMLASTLLILGTFGCGAADFAGGSGKKDKVITEEPPQVLQPTDPPFSQQITDQEVMFGSDKVFHIGDNNYPSSSCKEQIDSYKISGNRYFFEFEVTQPQTTLDIKLNTVCGVDYAGSNNALLVSGSSVLKKIPLATSASNLNFGQITVDQGRYAIVVESLRNFEHIRRGDNDDFLVGKIDVKANKKIIAGGVRTE